MSTTKAGPWTETRADTWVRRFAAADADDDAAQVRPVYDYDDDDVDVDVAWEVYRPWAEYRPGVDILVADGRAPNVDAAKAAADAALLAAGYDVAGGVAAGCGVEGLDPTAAPAPAVDLARIAALEARVAGLEGDASALRDSRIDVLRAAANLAVARIAALAGRVDDLEDAAETLAGRVDDLEYAADDAKDGAPAAAIAAALARAPVADPYHPAWDTYLELLVILR